MKVNFMLRLLAKLKISIALVLILSACSDIQNSVNPANEQVKSEVKWKCDNNGNKLYKIYFKEYDNTGNVTKITEYDKDGSILSIKLVNYAKEVSQETVNYFNKLGSIDSTVMTQNSYDQVGNLINKISYSVAGDTLLTYSYKYDNSGKLIYSLGKVKGSVGFTSVEIKYTYNSNGTLKERIQQDLTSGSLQKQDSFTYKPDNKTIEKITINFDGTENIFTYIYNNLGLIYKEIETDSSTKIINLFIYDYMYF
jgi:hypothetical protein